MHATSLNHLRAELIEAHERQSTTEIEKAASKSQFLRLAQACHFQDHVPEGFESSGLSLTFGEHRMLAAILDTKQEMTVPKIRIHSEADPYNYHFSVIICVKDTARFLPTLLNSLDSQTFSNFQIVFIDDASVDSSLSILRTWSSGRTNVSLIHSNVNLGPAAARNEALQFCSGKWITTVDSDDFIDRHYFERVDNFMETSADCAMYTTRPLRVNGANGEVADSLPLGFKYRQGDQVIDLHNNPTHIQLGATAFLNRQFLEENEVFFDPRVQPTFEDGNFIARYLLAISRNSKAPLLIGEVSSAFYFYRSRPERDSLVQSSWSKGERFDDQIKYGYLPLLSSCKNNLPLWLANTILYDISWYFTEELATRPRTQWIHSTPRLRDIFLKHLDSVFRFLPKESNPCRNLPTTVTDAWQALYWGGDEHGSFDQVFFGALTSKVDFDVVPPIKPANNPLSWFERMRIRRLITGDGIHTALRKAVRRRTSYWQKKSARIEAEILKRIPQNANRYRNALIFIDRAEGAGDNAEHLFRWVTKNTNEKAYFVLRKSSPSWERLHRDELKLLPYGSLRAKLAYLSARAIISSDAVVESRNLAPQYLYGRPKAPFIFLQHGVIYNKNIKSVSNWLNGIDIDLMITSTQEEYRLLTRSDSPFAISNERVKLVGMPRWDRLRSIKPVHNPAGRRRVMLMPTWFPDHEYQEWFSLASILSERHRVIFALHPSIAKSISPSGEPTYEILDPRVDDFQSALSSVDAFITDYTSAMFDALFLDKRVAFMFQKKGKILTDETAIQKIPVLPNISSLTQWLENGVQPSPRPAFIRSNSYCRDVYLEIGTFLTKEASRKALK